MRGACFIPRRPGDITAEALMTRAASAATIVLVEAPDDSRFAKRHLITDAVQIIICDGKPTVLASLVQIKARGPINCIAIIDRDFDSHKGVAHQADIFLNDEHDLETMLLAKRLNSLLEEYGVEGRISAFVEANAQSVESALLSRSSEFAKLRYLNEVDPAFNVAMSSLSPWKFIESKSWVLDLVGLQRDFANLIGETEQQLSQRLATLQRLDRWKDVRGHDVLKILSIGLERVLGDGKGSGESKLLSALRMLYSEHDFAASQLYAALTVWQQRTNVIILKPKT